MAEGAIFGQYLQAADTATAARESAPAITFIMIEASNPRHGIADIDRIGRDPQEPATSRLDYLIRIELGNKLRKIYAVDTSLDPQIQILIASLDALLTQSTKTE